MKILITGANGMLANAVKRRMGKDINNELICTDVSDLDITDQAAVEQFIVQAKPDYIINCAAFTAVDKAEETDYDLVNRINGKGPGNLARAANMVNATIIHISTDYVFDGELDVEKSYQETDPVGPVTVYGKTKLEGETQIKANTNQYYIFRTAWLYGEGNNFVRTMLKLGNSKDEISVVMDQHGSPTYAVDLANMIAEAIEKKIPFGIYHSTNEGFTTWYDFTKAIFEDAGIICQVNPVSTTEYINMMKITQAKRPKNSQLSKEKIKAQGITVPTWEDALKRYLEIELNQK